MTRTLKTLLCAGLLLAAPLAGQQTYEYATYTAEGTTPPGVAPGAPAGSYALSGFDDVSLFSGKLNLSLPMFTAKGRGDAGYTAVLNVENPWTYKRHQTCSAGDCGDPYYDPLPDWWSNPDVALYGPGKVIGRRSEETFYCSTVGLVASWALTRFTFVEPNGTEHELRDTQYQGQPLSVLQTSSCYQYPSSSRGTVFVSQGGEAMTFVSDEAPLDWAWPASGEGPQPTLPATGTLYFADGKKYRVEDSLVTKITDRHGNTIELEYDAAGRLTAAYEPNRTIRVAYQSTCDLAGETGELPACDKITISPAGSSTPFQTMYVYFSQLGDAGATVSSRYALFNGILPLEPYITPLNSEFDPVVIRRVRLPNGTRYLFSYNSYAEVTRVDLPTGGRFEYDYHPHQWQYEGPVLRRVSERREYDESARLRLRTETAYSSYGASPTVATVIDSTSLPPYYSSTQTARKTVHTFSGSSTAASTFYPVWTDGKETTTESRKPSDDTLLRRTVQDWENRLTVPWHSGGAATAPPTDPRLAQVTTYLEDGTTSSKVEYDYDDTYGYNNITTTREYGFGQSTASRWVNRSYVTSSSYTATPWHQRRLVSTEEVVGTSGQEAYTVFEYDTETLASASGAYWENPSTTYRGNATRMKRLYSGRYVTTTKTFDQLGNVRTLTEPLDSGENINRVTQYAYTCEGAYLSTLTNPKSQTASWTYSDCSLGKPTGYTDTNSAAYTYSYSDSLLRLTGVSEAGGLGQVGYAYVDTPGSVSVTATRQQDACSGSADIVTKTDYDGLGRAVKVRTTDDTGNIYADTMYDGFGSVVRQYEPYRSSQGAYTETTYDGLGRTVSVASSSDSATTRMGYILNQAYVRDPAGKWRRNTTDALGRLTEVREDALVNGSSVNPIPGYSNPSGTDLSTTYTYNARDGLLTVTQGSQTRTFVYDSLGRLTSAANPESGTTSYTYRDNGNLYTKTDAGSVVVTSGWDPLNRIKQKSYSGGVATPTVTYCYDGDTSGACAGAPSGSAGNLTMVSNSNSVTKYTSYDLLRRVTGSSQKIGTDTALAFSYTYNKASGLETETYPSGRQVKTCYDQAGRPKSVRNGSDGPYYANNITYGPHGGMTSVPLGNGVTETWSYLRMQPTSMEAVLSGSSKWKLENFYCVSQQSSCASNNGNVISQRLTAPKTAGGTLVLTQAYGYDNVNRISSASESGAGTTWSQGYTLDRYGNLTPTGDQPAPSLACAAYSSTTNRCTTSGFGYSTAGNMNAFPGSRTATYDAEGRQATLTDSGTTYTYTYDGDGRRVKKEGGGTTVKFVYDALGRLAAEYSTAAASSPCATCYLTADHLGSTRLMTNHSGTPLRRYDYFPFGQEIASGYGSRTTVTGYTTDTLNPKFTGKPRDYESGLGLDYFGARYYSAAQGRFTSPDPTFMTEERLGDPQQWNLYSYTRNNPLKYIDPDGRDLRLAVTNQVVGQSYVNRLPGGRSVPGQVSQAAPLYQLTVENDSGTTASFSVTRDTNFTGPIERTRGLYGSDQEAPPGTYVGDVRKDGDRGFRIQLSDKPGESTIMAPDGTIRRNVQIHVGPGCSQGCMLLPGGRAGRDAFGNTIHKMLREDAANGKGTAIQVTVQDRNRPSAAEARKREEELRKKREEEKR